MAGETQITLCGNVVADPELKFIPSGAAVCNFRMASTPRTFDRTSNDFKDGEPLFLTVNVWRQQAEQVAESVTRGMRVVVIGVLKSRTFDTKEGEKRTVYEVEAEDVAVSLKFATAKVSKAQGGGQRQQGGGQQSQQQGQPDPWASSAPQQQRPQQGSGGWGAPAAGNFPDEAPF